MGSNSFFYSELFQLKSAKRHSNETIFYGQNVVAIIDTRSSKVVVSESCFRQLGLIQDGEIMFTITSATNTNWKTRKILKKLEVQVRNSKVMVPAIVLEGLHFDVLPGISWLKETGAIIDVVNGSIRIQGEQVPN